MDNSQKAIQMAFAVFFFVIATTTAIFLYTNLIENAEAILLISDRARMSAENALADDISYKRYITRDEVIMTILDIENNKSYLDKIEFRKGNGDLLYTFLPDTDTQNFQNLKYLVSNFTKNSMYFSEYKDKTLIYTFHHNE
ncbi:MAG: hypothetical protein IKK43_04370 [Clostridia bacterium]|nr:hypothetical protein [Clostridia bacterium]